MLHQELLDVYMLWHVWGLQIWWYENRKSRADQQNPATAVKPAVWRSLPFIGALKLANWSCSSPAGLALEGACPTIAPFGAVLEAQGADRAVVASATLLKHVGIRICADHVSCQVANSTSLQCKACEAEAT